MRPVDCRCVLFFCGMFIAAAGCGGARPPTRPSPPALLVVAIVSNWPTHLFEAFVWHHGRPSGEATLRLEGRLCINDNGRYHLDNVPIASGRKYRLEVSLEDHTKQVTATMPSAPRVLQPLAGQRFADDDSVDVRWAGSVDSVWYTVTMPCCLQGYPRVYPPDSSYVIAPQWTTPTVGASHVSVTVNRGSGPYWFDLALNSSNTDTPASDGFYAAMFTQVPISIDGRAGVWRR